jgi:hypothetical protein
VIEPWQRRVSLPLAEVEPWQRRIDVDAGAYEPWQVIEVVADGEPWQRISLDVFGSPGYEQWQYRQPSP